METKGELKAKLAYLFNRSERLYWALKENRLDDAKEISDEMATTLGHGEPFMFGETYKELAKKKSQEFNKELKRYGTLNEGE